MTIERSENQEGVFFPERYVSERMSWTRMIARQGSVAWSFLQCSDAERPTIPDWTREQWERWDATTGGHSRPLTIIDIGPNPDADHDAGSSDYAYSCLRGPAGFANDYAEREAILRQQGGAYKLEQCNVKEEE